MTGLKEVQRFYMMKKNREEDRTRWLSLLFKELPPARLEQFSEAPKSRVRADGQQSQS